MKTENKIIVDSRGNKEYYNSDGHLIKTVRTDGSWEEYTSDTHGNDLTYKDSKGIWYEYTRDQYGNELTYKDSKGSWWEYTRDEFGNELSYENSTGFWYKYTRDSEGNLLTREDNDGLITYLTGDKLYGLYYQDGLYKAGCHKFTYDQAIEHWTKRAKEDNEVVKARAVKFLATIEKHHEGLTK